MSPGAGGSTAGRAGRNRRGVGAGGATGPSGRWAHGVCPTTGRDYWHDVEADVSVWERPPDATPEPEEGHSVVCMVTEEGGHVGWPTPAGLAGGDTWLGDVCVRFARALEG